MPAGPWSIPLLGVAHRIDKDAPHKTYTEWSKQHGDVISMTLFGTQKVVVVSSEAAIRDVMITKADYFSGKYISYYTVVCQVGGGSINEPCLEPKGCFLIRFPVPFNIGEPPTYPQCTA